ncbi:MAG: D-2-hydroxyacid dehydrogenase [Solobacterium sp.]|nr:D-2-hydroxyacid dehydrogenase [Solobacterium sp.]
MKIIFATDLPASKRDRFTALYSDIQFINRSHYDLSDVLDADVILGNLPTDVIRRCTNLKWLQLDSAGANNYSFLGDDVILTNASGAYGEAISEHMLAAMLMGLKNLGRYYDMQKEHESYNLGSVRTISCLKVLSVGMGDIGSSFAQKLSLLGAEVYGVRRSVHDVPDYVKGMYTMKNMDDILPECDVVALSMPETPETIRMFDEARLRRMKKDAILVNVGRGSAVDTDALFRVMRDGHLAAACLDVTDPEPLPKNHPLWTADRVYITPHISGRFNAEVTYDKVLAIFEKNLKHYLNGEPLENVVDKKIGY